MGTWATGSFGNDSAGDWAIDLLENPTFEFFRETLEASIEEPYDSMLNENAIAAAEVLCMLDGFVPADYDQVSHNLGPAISKLKEQSMPSDLKRLALQSVESIEEDSELKELWEENEEWKSEIQDLKQRLKA